jgi:tRNA (cmo5U34)-methyltransferase
MSFYIIGFLLIRKAQEYSMTSDIPDNLWGEETSQRYLDYGRYFVPERELQMRIMVDLLRNMSEPCNVLELCCGEGLLAELLLDEIPGSSYWGLDGSQIMLERARQRLTRFGDRVRLGSFNLADHAWRPLESSFKAVVSSLAIHHLKGEVKQLLFKDVYTMLSPGGAFIVADMIEPATSQGRAVAADAWDGVVRERAQELDGNTAGFDFFQREGWNTYRYLDPDDIDHPSPLFDQLKWLEQAGFIGIDVHYMKAGHALFSGWK